MLSRTINNTQTIVRYRPLATSCLEVARIGSAVSDVYTVREEKGHWVVHANGTPFMTFAQESTAREFATEAQKLVEEARAKDAKMNILPWRR